MASEKTRPLNGCDNTVLAYIYQQLPKFMKYSNFLKSQNLYVSVFLVFPIFTLIQKGWISGSLFVSTVVALIFLGRNKPRENEVRQHIVFPSVLKLFILVFSMPTIAIGLGQLLRRELILADFDGPLRLLLAIPILLVVSRGQLFKHFGRPVVTSTVQYCIPLTLIVTFIYMLVAPYDRWGSNRLTTYFVDPLTFGSMCLTFSLVTFSTIHLFQRDCNSILIFKFTAIAAGIYLSILSGSRTGWLGLPLVLLVAIGFRSKNFGLIKSVQLVALCGLAIALLWLTSQVVQNRMSEAVYEISSYRWNSPNLDTSVGLRISFLRMAWFYFTENPLSGWGDQGWIALINSPEIAAYTTQFAREFAKNGFHNEIATNMVKSGIGGLVSSIGILFAPIIYFFSRLRSECVLCKKLAFVGICYSMPVLVSAMTTEVLGLKFAASFYSLFLAILIGSMIHAEKNA